MSAITSAGAAVADGGAGIHIVIEYPGSAIGVGSLSRRCASPVRRRLPDADIRAALAQRIPRAGPGDGCRHLEAGAKSAQRSSAAATGRIMPARNAPDEPTR